MGISIGFGLGPLRFSAPLVPNGGGRRRSPHRPIVTAAQYAEEQQRRAQYVAAQRRTAPVAQRPVVVAPRKSHPVLKAFGIAALVPAGLFLLIFQAGVFGAHGFWAGLLWLLFQVGIVLAIALPKIVARRARRNAAKAAVIARAEYEHAAIMRGDTNLGVHGAYQPKGLPL